MVQHAKLNVIQQINETEEENYMIISSAAKKPTEKLQNTFMKKKKKPQQIWNRTTTNMIKAIDEKPIANIILNSKRWKAFSLRSRTRPGCTLLQFLFNCFYFITGNASQRH